MPDPARLLDLTRRCMHCGICLPACPTYEIFGTEIDRPRGRIVLAQALAEQALPITDRDLILHLDRCLACRACEVACPSGVQFGAILEFARTQVAARKRPALAERLVRHLVLDRMIPTRAPLRALAVFLWLYQRSGLQWLVRRLGFLPTQLAEMEQLLPPLTLAWTRPHPPAAAGQPRVAFFSGCVQDAFLSEINRATISILEKNGFHVVVPGDQSCCGALHGHLEEHEMACAIAAAQHPGFCGRGRGGCDRQCRRLRRASQDLRRVARRRCGLSHGGRGLYQPGLRPERVPGRPRRHHASQTTPTKSCLAVAACSADSCHLRNAQHVVDAPRRLIRAIPGVEYIELEGRTAVAGAPGFITSCTRTSPANCWTTRSPRFSRREPMLS